MKYLKVQGTLNDFVLIDERVEALHLTDEQRAAWAVKLCDREQGIGADGILYVNASEVADAKMRIFNADGSEALMCGNGLRCFGRYILEDLHKQMVTIETLKAVYKVKLDRDFDQKLMGYEIMLDNVKYYGETPQTLLFQKETQTLLSFEHLTVSNPHIVSFCTLKELQDDSLIPLGRFANENKAVFSEGMNVNLVHVLSERQIYVRTYERGVGITKSCGTGMTSSVTAYVLKTGQLDTPIKVFNDGGYINCIVSQKDGGYAVRFTGNATYIQKGQILSPLEATLSFSVDTAFEAETAVFDAFLELSRREIGF